MNLKKLMGCCYLAALIIWLAQGVGVLVQTAWYAHEGLAATRSLGLDELELVSFRPYEDVEYTDGGWYISTDTDPQFHWQQRAWVRRVVLDITHIKPGCGVELYYRLPGQADFSARQTVYATRDAEGRLVFDLGGKLVEALRIDPDSVGGVLTRFHSLTINPPQGWYTAFVPSAGEWMLLLGLPLLAAALIAETGSLLGLPRQRRVRY